MPDRLGNISGLNCHSYAESAKIEGHAAVLNLTGQESILAVIEFTGVTAEGPDKKIRVAIPLDLAAQIHESLGRLLASKPEPERN